MDTACTGTQAAALSNHWDCRACSGLITHGSQNISNAPGGHTQVSEYRYAPGDHTQVFRMSAMLQVITQVSEYRHAPGDHTQVFRMSAMLQVITQVSEYRHAPGDHTQVSKHCHAPSDPEIKRNTSALQIKAGTQCPLKGCLHYGHVILTNSRVQTMASKTRMSGDFVFTFFEYCSTKDIL